MARVLVACEESQTVTKELRALGIEAYSCDILPCSGGHTEWHYQRDVLEIINDGWDMIIAFPPCTHLANSGAKWFKQKQEDGRQPKAIDFFMSIINADCPKIAVENPVGIMSSKFRKPDQIIQPYMFGDNYKKTTCLWLKGLPELVQTVNKEYEEDFVTFPSGKRMSKWYYKTGCMDHNQRTHLRSKMPKGMAKAMADQWSKELTNKKEELQCTHKMTKKTT